MRGVSDKFLELYQEVKHNPQLIFKNPYCLILTPAFLVLFVKKRWNTSPERIYLTETKIFEHLLLSKGINHSYQIRKIIDYQNASSLINQRIKEENISLNYIEETKKRFYRGDYLMVLFVNNLPASFLFVAEKIAYFQQFNLKVALDNDCFAVYDVFTFISFRGKGLYEELLSNVLNQMRNYNKFWLWVMQHNQISVKVHSQLQINHVVRIYEEYFRFGFRVLKNTSTDFLLSKLITK